MGLTLKNHAQYNFSYCKGYILNQCKLPFAWKSLDALRFLRIRKGLWDSKGLNFPRFKMAPFTGKGSKIHGSWSEIRYFHLELEITDRQVITGSAEFNKRFNQANSVLN